MKYDFIITGTVTNDGIKTGIGGCIPISIESAKSWGLYPDWEKRKTIFDSPALLFTVENNKISIRMPVGDYSIAPIEAYLPQNDIDELYAQANLFVKTEQSKHEFNKEEEQER